MAPPIGRRALVLYGSETGNAQDVAEEIGRLCERLRFDTQISDLNSVSLVCTWYNRESSLEPAPLVLLRLIRVSDNCSNMISSYLPYPPPAKVICLQTLKRFGRGCEACGCPLDVCSLYASLLLVLVTLHIQSTLAALGRF